MNKIYIKVILIIVTIIVLSQMIQIIFGLYIKKFGIKIVPLREFKPGKHVYFFQNDPLWENDLIGESGLALGSHGCLVSVIATVLNSYEIPIEVRKLNKIFSQKKVYDETGNIIWYRINEIVPEIQYSYSKLFSRQTIENDLSLGRLPIVKVKYFKNGPFHWVLIVGSNENDFLIIDPLRQDKKIIELSIHGKIYAYRVLYKMTSL